MERHTCYPNIFVRIFNNAAISSILYAPDNLVDQRLETVYSRLLSRFMKWQ